MTVNVKMILSSPLIEFMENNSNVGLLTGKCEELMENILEVINYFHHYQKIYLEQDLLEYS